MRLSAILCRVPVIRFRKGGAGKPAAPPSPAGGGGCPVGAGPKAAPGQAQPAAPMSTSTIPDIDLPARYRRAPLSDEEIAFINGGGIV